MLTNCSPVGSKGMLSSMVPSTPGSSSLAAVRLSPLPADTGAAPCKTARRGSCARSPDSAPGGSPARSTVRAAAPQPISATMAVSNASSPTRRGGDAEDGAGTEGAGEEADQGTVEGYHGLPVVGSAEAGYPRRSCKACALGRGAPGVPGLRAASSLRHAHPGRLLGPRQRNPPPSPAATRGRCLRGGAHPER